MGATAVGSSIDYDARHASADWAKYFRRWQTREWEFSEFREFICQIPRVPGYEDHCYVWSHIQMANYILLALVSLALALMLFGVFTMYYYTYVEAATRTRRVSKIIFQIAFILMLVGMTCYVYFVQGVKEFFPRSRPTPFGNQGLLACVITLASVVPTVVSAACTGRDHEELLHEVVSAQKKAAHEFHGSDRKPIQQDFADHSSYGSTAVPSMATRFDDCSSYGSSAVPSVPMPAQMGAQMPIGMHMGTPIPQQQMQFGVPMMHQQQQQQQQQPQQHF